MAMTMPALHYIGWSADFCPICRTLRAFIVYELRGGNRFVWAFHRVPRQEGDRIIVCEACGVYWSEQHQPRVCVVDPPETYEELVRRTNPTLAEVHADRLNIEERVMRRRLSPGERAALLEEPLRLVEGMGAIDLLTYLRGFWFWTVAGLVFVAAVLLVASIKNWDHELVFLAGCLPLLAFLWTLRRIQFRRRALRILATALKPLSPSTEELDQVFGNLRREKCRVVRLVSCASVQRAINAVRDSTMSQE